MNLFKYLLVTRFVSTSLSFDFESFFKIVQFLSFQTYSMWYRGRFSVPQFYQHIEPSPVPFLCHK